MPRELTFAPFRGSDAVADGLLTRRQLAGAYWRRLLPDVYAHATLPLDHLAWCHAAGLAFDGRAALSGRSAALVWGVDVVPKDAPVEITVAGAGWARTSARLSVVRSQLAAGDVTRRLGLPVTAPARTAFDLGRHLPLVEAVVSVDAMCHARLVTLDEFQAYAAARAGWPGTVQLAAVLALVDPPAESPMETRLRLVVIGGGLPTPVSQHEVYDRHGRLVARLDLAYPFKRLGLEYDGNHHRDRPTFRRDTRRQNALRECGWTLLRFTAADIYNNSHKIVETVGRALTQAGATGG